MSSQTIIIANDMLINEFSKTNTYYINNSNKSVTITLGVPKIKYALIFYLMDSDGYDCIIYIQKGYYFIEPSNPHLHLIYNGKWQAIGTTPVPFLDDKPKQELEFNLFNNAETGKEFILIEGYKGNNIGKLSNPEDTTSQKLYKIDKNLILLNSPNYQVSDVEDSNGVGAVIVYENFEDQSVRYHSTLSQSYIQGRSKQGNFSTHLFVLPMENYDLLIVSSPSIFKNYCYSFRKNNYNQFYFHLEFEQQTTGIEQIKFIKPINNFGYIYFSNAFYTYNVDKQSETNVNSISMSTILNLEIKNNLLLIVDSNHVINEYIISRDASQGIIFTKGKTLGIPNGIVDSNFGKQLIIDSLDKLHVISDKYLFVFQNFIETKRHQFNELIISFDVIIDNNDTKYLLLLDSNLLNIYLMKNGEVLMSDYISESEQTPLKIKFSNSKQTFYVSYPNVGIVDDTLGNIQNMGYIVRYDLYLDTKDTKTSIFPKFNIGNQLLLEQFTSNLTFESRWLEQQYSHSSGFQIDLISNKGKQTQNISKIEPVYHDTGIILDFDTSQIESLVNYPIYKVYSNLEPNNIINPNNKYLRINVMDKLKYIRPFENPITQKVSDYYDSLVIKNNSEIYQFLLSMGENNKWNLIKYTFTQQEVDQQPIVLIKESNIPNASNELPIHFKNYVFDDQIIFIIEKIDQAIVVFYSLSTNVVTHKIFDIGPKHVFLVDEFKNLFDFNGLLLQIYPYSVDYKIPIRISYEIEMTEEDQIYFKYKNNKIYILHNKITDDQSNIRFWEFNTATNNITNGITSTLQISNLNSNKNYILSFVIDPQPNLIVCDYNDINTILLHPFTQKVYKIPKIATYQFNSYERLSESRMIYNIEKEFVLNDVYKINDTIPKQFYHEFYYQFFYDTLQKNLSLLNRRYFYDNRKAIDLEDNIYIIERKNNTMQKRVIEPSNGYKIINYAYDSINNIIGYIEKSFTDLNYKFVIYNLENIQQKVYEKVFNGTELCSLTNTDTKFTFVQKETPTILKIWTIHKTNFQENISWQLGKSEETIQPSSIDPKVCVYISPTLNERILIEDHLDLGGRLVYWVYQGLYQEKRIYKKFLLELADKPISLTQPFNINFTNDKFILYDNLNSYLFSITVSNSEEISLHYLGKAIDQIYQYKTFEISESSFINMDSTLSFDESNVTITSPLFYSRNEGKNQLYLLEKDQIFQLDITLNGKNLMISENGLRIQIYIDSDMNLNEVKGEEFSLNDNFLEKDIDNWILNSSLFNKIFTQTKIYKNNGSEVNRLSDIRRLIYYYDKNTYVHVFITGYVDLVIDLRKIILNGNNPYDISLIKYQNILFVLSINERTSNNKLIKYIEFIFVPQNLTYGTVIFRLENNPFHVAMINFDFSPILYPYNNVFIIATLDTESTLSLMFRNTFSPYSEAYSGYVVDTGVDQTGNILFTKNFYRNFGMDIIILSTPILVYVKNNQIYIHIRPYNLINSAYVNGFKKILIGDVSPHKLLQIISIGTYNYMLRIQNNNRLILDKFGIDQSTNGMYLSENYYNVEITSTTNTSLSSGYFYFMHSNTTNLLKILWYHDSKLQYIEVDLNLNLMMPVYTIYSNLNNVTQIFLYEENNQTFAEYFISPNVKYTEIIENNLYSTKFNSKIYTILSPSKFIRQDTLNSPNFTVETDSNSLSISNKGQIFIDYLKSLYYFDNNNNVQKLDYNNQLTRVDNTNSTYISFPIDQDENIRVSIDRSKYLFMNDFYYNEVLYGEETLKLDDYYSFKRDDGYTSISLDGNEFMFIDQKNKIIYLSRRNINNIFEVKQTFIPESSILQYISLDDIFSAVKIDWKNKYIYFGLASLDANGKGLVLVCSWTDQQNNYKLENVLKSIINPTSTSFGMSIDVSPFGDIIAIGEPMAPPVGKFLKLGMVHIYTRSNESIVWTNELRSEDSPVGLIVKLSALQQQLATIGTTNSLTEKPKLVMFRSILIPVKRYITLPYNVSDFDFFGKDTIMTSNEVIDQKSLFHWIQKVNQCFEIVTTRDVTHDTIINKLTDTFDICAIRNNFAILIRKKRNNKNVYEETSIELYKIDEDLNLYATIDLIEENIKLFSNIACSNDGTTMLYQTYNSGNFNFIMFF